MKREAEKPKEDPSSVPAKTVNNKEGGDERPRQKKDQGARCTEATSTSCLVARMFRSLPAPFLEACFLSEANFIVSDWDMIGQGQYVNCG